MSKNFSAQDLDIRVRERHLRSGTLSEKDLETHIQNLPDLTDALEVIALPQPALDAPEEFDDEDEDDEDEDDQASTEGA